MIDAVIAWLQQADPASVYLLLFLSAFLENIIPPIPGDIPVAFAGYLLVFNQISFFWALFWSTLGSTGGFFTVFLLSRTLGLKLYASGQTEARHRFARSVHKLFPPSEMEIVRQKFSRHGYMAVLANRFLFGSRAVISVVSGLLHLRISIVFLAALTSATLWNSMLLYGGFVLGRNWNGIGKYLALYSIPVTILFLGYIAWTVVKYVRKRKQEG
ncbi:MAG: DedA family protein [Chlorobiaceae bacterium]|nr:DedA family protein [Chlorobiaceae bacterium]NTW74464.1 DedA family protein [Chlorobiaceae bacterium]